VDNLVHAYILASEKLAKEAISGQEQVVSGQAYFISDQEPMNNFEFMRPLVEGLGYPFPKLRVSVSVMIFFGLINGKTYYFTSNIHQKFFTTFSARSMTINLC
jgi:hypothetical protein